MTKRLDRAAKELGIVQDGLASIEPKQAEKHSLNLAKLLDDVKETVNWVADVRKDVSGLPRTFFPRARKRTITVFQPGEKLILRETAPATYGFAAKGELFEVIAVDKQSVSWRTTSGAVGAGMTSHFQRPDAPVKTPAGSGPGRKKKSSKKSD
jgi:hypothetical protein